MASQPQGQRLDFFGRQEWARKRTRLLVILFILAVLAIVAAVNGAAFAILVFSGHHPLSVKLWVTGPGLLYTSGLTIAIIAIGTAAKLYALRGGGSAVAEMAGGRKIDSGGETPDERRLVNVVEEMAIASGVPVPDLYIIDDEPAINAFVAGLTPAETVLVVTKGAVENLSRDELQGVMGHEFSHIFHGDMRLNVRLMGLLAGILAIGQSGQFLLRSLFPRDDDGTFRRSRRGTGRGGLFIVAAGIALLLIGYVGLFFGRLIKAAISRQREFLADAASVQYTRNPYGIGGALVKIRNHYAGTILGGRHAEEMSHLCFGESVQVLFPNLLATHPPLEERINAIEPALLRGMPSPTQAVASRTLSASVAADQGGVRLAPADATALAGAPQRRHLAYAGELKASIPQEINQLVHNPRGAKALVYLMLFPAEPAAVKDSLRLISEREGNDLSLFGAEQRQKVAALPARLRLPLLEMAAPALRLLAQEARKDFLETVAALVKMDTRITPFEYAVHAVLRKLLGFVEAAPEVRHASLDLVAADLGVLISALASAGHSEQAMREQAFQTAVSPMAIKHPPLYSPTWTLARIDRALNSISHLVPHLKKPVLEACIRCVSSDGTINTAEAELVRLVAVYLDVPLPPLIAEVE